ncbi:MAG: hypothetical protein HOV87_19700 [Catenulispora sp.]|nr:hypothetical protein [Catenulispora sp.]
MSDYVAGEQYEINAAPHRTVITQSGAGLRELSHRVDRHCDLGCDLGCELALAHEPLTAPRNAPANEAPHTRPKPDVEYRSSRGIAVD